MEIRDPGGLAADASELVFEIRESYGTILRQATRAITGAFPLTIAISARDPREVEINVTALNGLGVAIARGRSIAPIKDSTTPILLNLAAACENDCDDGLFCNGQERCDRGVCIPGTPPCRPSFSCVVETCIEEGEQCSTTVDHGACAQGDGVSRYCSPSSGCIVGQACIADDDCQDESACNGEERCVDFRCEAGSSPDLNDGSPCTIDGCNDTNTNDPFFHLPDSTKDGNTCELESGAAGICLSTSSDVCVASLCGDGFRDPFREPCDDGNDDNTDGCIKIPRPGGLVCAEAECGDGYVQAGIEVCDDGNTLSGDGCRSDCLKVESCGDGFVDQGEACDDGNANPNDGCDQCRRTSWTASVISGFGSSAGDPLNLSMSVKDLTTDRLGNVFVVDEDGGRVWRVDAIAGVPTVVAGTGVGGFSGDGGPATSAQLFLPGGIAVDGLGNVFIADTYNNRIRQVCSGAAGCPSGTIRTIAGTGEFGYSGDGSSAKEAQFRRPEGVAVDGLGNVYVADTSNGVVRQICAGDADCPAGHIRTLVGPTVGHDDLGLIRDVAVDQLGNLFLTSSNHRIVEYCVAHADCPAGTVRTVAGTGVRGHSGDGGLAVEAKIGRPFSVSVDSTGNVFFADRANHCIRKVCGGDAECAAGMIQTVAGTGAQAGYSGDGMPAVEALLSAPQGVEVDHLGNLFVADTGNRRVRHVCAGDETCTGGLIRTLAGTGLRAAGDRGPATSTPLPYLDGVAVNAAGDVFVSILGRVQEVCAGRIDCESGAVRTVAGTGQPGFSGDGGPATSAELHSGGLVFDVVGNLYIADGVNQRVRQLCAGDEICPAGTIRTVAGTGEQGYSGDGGPATSAQIYGPQDLAFDTAGNLYIAGDSSVRQLCVGDETCSAGEIRTIAGTGVNGSSGNGGPATSARVAPRGIAVDRSGNVYIAEGFKQSVRKVCAGDADCPAGTIIRFAGTGGRGPLGDGGPATLATLLSPMDVEVDDRGNVFIADFSDDRIREVCIDEPGCPPGTIRTVVGTGESGFSGDNGPAKDAKLDSPSQLAFDRFGNLLIAERQRVRRVCVGDETCLAGTIHTVAGNIHPGDGPLVRSKLSEPFALAPFNTQWLVADGVSGRVRVLDLPGDRLASAVGYPGGYPDDDVIAGYSRELHRPRGIAFDPAGSRFFVSELDGGSVRVINTAVSPWTVSTLDTADLSTPAGLLFDSVNHRLLVADRDNHVVRSVDASSGATTTLVGSLRTRGVSRDGEVAEAALLNAPEALAFGPDSSVYIADTGNNRVLRVDGAGLVHTVLGDGTAASSGEGAPASFFPVNTPRGLATDSHGNLAVSSSTTLRLVSAGADGIATGEDTVSTIYGTSPRNVFPASVTNCLTGIAFTENDEGTQESRLIALDSCVGMALALTRVAK